MKSHTDMRLLVFLACVILVTACQTGGRPMESYPTAAPLHEIELLQEIFIPPNAARAFFQNGVQVPKKDRYEPHCEFEISTVSEQSQRVAPDTFTIARVTRRRVSDEDAGIPIRIGVFGSQDIFHETHLWLNSESQPGVRKLICRSWTQHLGQGGFLSIRQMQAVLGDNFLFR